MRIIFAGTPDTAVPALHQLHEDHEVLAVLTRAPAPVGRKRVMTKSPVHVAAEQLGLPVLTPRTLKDDAVAREIAEYEPEAVAVVAYGLHVPKALLDVPAHGWINLHFSDLPRWRGAAPVQFSIMAGDPQIATSVFHIEEGLDTGPVYSTERVDRDPDATAGDVLEQLAESGASQLSRTLTLIENDEATAVAQEGEPTHAPQLRSSDAYVDFSRPADEIANLILGTTPAPGPWATFGGTRIKLSPVRVLDSSDLQPGVVEPGLTVRVGTATNDVELTNVSPAGKKSMPAADWARGLHDDHPSFDVETK